LPSHACRSPQTKVKNSEKIRTGLPHLGHPILEVSIPILLLVKSIVIDVERSLKGDRQAAPPELGICVYLFFVMMEMRQWTHGNMSHITCLPLDPCGMASMVPGLDLSGFNLVVWDGKRI